jgi:hypothetical protein
MSLEGKGATVKTTTKFMNPTFYVKCYMQYQYSLFYYSYVSVCGESGAERIGIYAILWLQDTY